MTDLILSIPFALGALAGLAAGYLLACWRVSRATGQPLLNVLRGGGNGEERATVQRGGGNGEER